MMETMTNKVALSSEQLDLEIHAMFQFLKSLFASSDHAADEQRRHETENQAQARKLELDEPMAGAGALLSAEERPSETEAALKSASREPKRL
jgi:hypothetical protein